MVKENYDNISTIEGLAAIRKRPGMYVGSPQSLDGKNPSALLQIAQEVLSNAIDEAYAGFGKEISLTIHEDNSMTVSDQGRGMPKGDDFDSVIRGFTVLHSSGKFDSSNYASSIGQNGIGNKAVTALSKWVSVDATTDKETYHIAFEQEKVIEQSSEKKQKSNSTGTTVTFLPDDSIFDTIIWDDAPIINKLEQSAFLTPKVKFIFVDERKKNEETGEFFQQEWYSENGMPDYVAYVAEDEELVSGLKEPISFESDFQSEDGSIINVQGAVLYTENTGETIISFANGAPTIDGGPHEDGAKMAISKAFIDFAKDKKIIKANKSLDATDTRDGMILALLVKIPENLLMFESQSKTKLATVAAKEATRKVMYDAITSWLYDNERSAKKIVEKMLESRDAREAAIMARKAAKAARDTRNGGGKLFVSSKLMPASSKKKEERELYIVEGDSAGGATKKARNPKTQAIFPIRGKLLNTQNEKLTRILANEEISTIASVIGAGIGSAFELKDIQYDKVLINSDADDDGYHIRSLVITLFYKYFPGFIQAGHLYFVNAPLFKLTKYVKGQPDVHFAYSDSEVEALQEKLGNGYEISRFKGLGEMDAMSEARPTLMNPDTRIITQVTVDDVRSANRTLEILMGKDATKRRKWITENIEFEFTGEEV